MASRWDRVAEGARAQARRVDEGVAQALIAAVRAPSATTREALRRRGWAFVDPTAPPPHPDAVRRTAERLVEASAGRATALGGLAGLGGVASVPPEVAAQLVALVRLAQRLAVVYGFDPDTERGRIAVWQALAAGLEIELPQGGPLGLRLTDLPSVLAGRAPRDASVAMTRALVRGTAWMIVGRLGRFVPVFSAGFGAVDGRRRVQRVGGRMIDALARLADLPVDASAGIVDAVEVRTP
jgi:hypothetical protein